MKLGLSPLARKHHPLGGEETGKEGGEQGQEGGDPKQHPH